MQGDVSLGTLHVSSDEWYGCGLAAAPTERILMMTMTMMMVTLTLRARVKDTGIEMSTRKGENQKKESHFTA